MTVKDRIFKFLNPWTFTKFVSKEIVTILFGMTVLSVYVIIIFLSIPVYLYRFILLKLSHHLNPDLGKMLQARSQYLSLEKFTSSGPTVPRSNVVSYLALQGYASVEQIREKLQTDLVEAKDDKGNSKFPEAKQFVTSYMGYKFWRNDPKFSIENHVTEWFSKENFVTSEKLRDLLESLVNQPFQPERSPWEFLIVYNFVNPDLSDSTMTLLVIKFHHCLADGFGALFTFVNALSTKPFIFPRPRFSERGGLRLLLFKLTYPLRLIREISHFIAISFQRSPWKIRDSKKAWKQLYQVSSVIPIEKLKEIKNQFGVSFTSVVHSAIAAGMEKCLVHMYGTEVSKSLKNVPSVMMLPLPGHPRKFRNHCTGAYTNLPTNQMDPLIRLRKCDLDLLSVKNSTLPMLGRWLPVIGGSEPIPFARLIGKNRAFPVSLSNFPLGISEYEIAERKVVHISCVAGPAPGVCGLGILIHTYLDKLQIGFLGEQGVFSRNDLDLLVKVMEDEIDELHRYALV